MHVGSLDTILTLAGLAIVLGRIVAKITIPANAIVRELADANAPPAATATPPSSQHL